MPLKICNEFIHIDWVGFKKPNDRRISTKFNDAVSPALHLWYNWRIFHHVVRRRGGEYCHVAHPVFSQRHALRRLRPESAAAIRTRARHRRHNNNSITLHIEKLIDSKILHIEKLRIKITHCNPQKSAYRDSYHRRNYLAARPLLGIFFSDCLCLAVRNLPNSRERTNGLPRTRTMCGFPGVLFLVTFALPLT